MAIEHDPEEQSLDEEFGPVTHSFLITTRPAGSVPDAIREMWVGVNLPVRKELSEVWPTEYTDDLSGEFRQNDFPVAVLVEDAVVALLDQGRQPAADFWGSYFSPKDTLVFHENEGFLSAVTDEDN